MKNQSSLNSEEKRMYYVALACNFFVAMLGCAAIATSMASVVSTDWWHFKEENMTGLFEGKNATSGEYFNLDYVGFTEDWLLTVRAFFIMMIIFGGVGLVLCVASLLHTGGKKVALISAGLLFGSGVCGIVACAVYASKTDDVMPGYWYGTGFALGWVSCSFFFLAGIIQGATGGKTEDYKTMYR